MSLSPKSSKKSVVSDLDLVKLLREELARALSKPELKVLRDGPPYDERGRRGA